MRILLTGASGHLAKYCRKYFGNMKDHNIVSISRQVLTPYTNETTKQCDLLNIQELKAALADHTFDIIIHCASQQPRQNLTFDDYFNGNTLTLDNVLSTANLTPDAKVISFSSAVVYGHIKDTIINESTPVDPQSDYALTKCFGEQLLKIRAHQLGFNGYCLRLPSLFGPEQKGGIIDTYFQAAVNNAPLEIYSKGTLKRNVLSFDEVVTAIESICHHQTSTHFNLYLLGSKNSLSMGKIGKWIINYCKSQTEITLSEKKAPVEVDWDFDLKHIIQNLGYQPKSIETILEQYIDEASHE